MCSRRGWGGGADVMIEREREGGAMLTVSLLFQVFMVVLRRRREKVGTVHCRMIKNSVNRAKKCMILFTVFHNFL